MFHYDLEMKQQSLQWKTSKSPTLKKVKIIKSTGKVMIIFDYKGFVCHHAVSSGDYYYVVYEDTALLEETAKQGFQKASSAP